LFDVKRIGHFRSLEWSLGGSWIVLASWVVLAWVVMFWRTRRLEANG
jgi:hypothetical protein